jgi:hypothetical protein
VHVQAYERRKHVVTAVGALSGGIALGPLVPKEQMHLGKIDAICQKHQRLDSGAGSDAHGERALFRDRGVRQLLDTLHYEIADGGVILENMGSATIWQTNHERVRDGDGCPEGKRDVQEMFDAHHHAHDVSVE